MPFLRPTNWSPFGATRLLDCVTTGGVEVDESLPPNFHATITSAVSTAIPSSAEQDHAAFERSLLLDPRLPPLARRLLEAVGDEPRVVLVDVELAVEAQVLGVGPEEALDVRARREQLEMLVLERLDVLRADLRRELDLGVVEPLAHPRLAQAVADLEHPAGIVERRGSSPRGAGEARRSRRDRRREGDAEARDAEAAAEPDSSLSLPRARASRGRARRRRARTGAPRGRGAPPPGSPRRRRARCTPAVWRERPTATGTAATPTRPSRTASEAAVVTASHRAGRRLPEDRSARSRRRRR